MIERAMGHTFNVLIEGEHRIYKRTDGTTLFDNRVQSVDEMRAVLYIEGVKQQKEDE